MYRIIRNCNFESRDDEIGQAIHAARKAVEAQRTDDAELIDALDMLEETLAEHAESQHEAGMTACREAESQVSIEWAAVSARQAGRAN